MDAESFYRVLGAYDSMWCRRCAQQWCCMMTSYGKLRQFILKAA